MDKQRLAQALSAWLFCTLLVPTAYAEGAVSFNDNIVPMLKDRPQFKEFILQSFSVADTGWGVRIDSPTMPHMGGARMGPYRFQAIWHSPHGGTPITLVIDTKTEFFDSHRRQITGSDLRETTSITETLESIGVEPPEAQ
ncbi:hypothetical protein F6X40_08115 [Paraburkholderia sp. UCT31]|uniref:hypothetical protein n=1 Tax=Paraburkholderia sp. UCT31 TaxID=2615209 RepID=UPI0016567B9B|nr:hypothetical protein [Paraburkholderia sp. UCT31]MBC8736777.1 hypothetical protein [Paraburkholderia sp. UCT31]